MDFTEQSSANTNVSWVRNRFQMKLTKWHGKLKKTSATLWGKLNSKFELIVSIFKNADLPMTIVIDVHNNPERRLHVHEIRSRETANFHTPSCYQELKENVDPTRELHPGLLD